MNATDRIVDEFNRLLSVGHKRIPERPFAEQVVFYVVVTRCEKDMEGFESVFEQGLDENQLGILIKGLRSIGENDLADDFARGFVLLQQEGFYRHRDYLMLSPNAKEQIEVIGERIGDRLWDLDAKLVALLDAPA